MTFKDLSEDEFLKRAEKQIEFLNQSLENIPQSKVRMHICWGNYEGPHLHDISLDKILPLILKANVGTYLLESSNPRHSHENVLDLMTLANMFQHLLLKLKVKSYLKKYHVNVVLHNCPSRYAF